MAAYVERRPIAPVVGRAVAWVLVIAAAALAARYGYARYTASKAASAAPQYFLQPATVGPVVETVSGSGTFEPATTTSVAPLVAGTVSQVDVQVGQSVARGQTLFQMTDTAGLAQQVSAAQAALDAAQKQLQQMEDPASTVDPRTVTMDQLQVQQAQLTLQEAQTNLQQAQAAAAAAAAVTAPAAGTVTAVGVTSGQQVTAGTVIATLQPAGAPFVTVSVPQDELPYLPVGTTATITASTLQATTTGTVSAIGQAASNSSSSTAASASSRSGTSSGASSPTASGLYPVTLTLASSGSSLPAGADVTVTFQPSGNPPAADTWSDGGTVAYPASIALSAAQAGTVGSLAADGAAVQAGQQVATVTPATTPAQVASDEAAVAQDQNSLQQAQLTLSEAQSPSPSSAAAIAAQQDAVAVAQDNLQTAQQNLADLTVTAPVAGIVQAVSVEPGTQMRAGSAAVTLQAAGPLLAQVDVDELEIAKVKAGQTATVTVPAFPTRTFQATVTGIAPTATTQFGVSYYAVALAVQGLPPDLRAGMTLNASILIQQVASALRVPAWAVTTFGSGGTGLVQEMRGGRPTPVPVSLGVTSSQWDQVLSGLTAGQRVVAGDVAAANTSTGLGAFRFLAGAGGAVRRGGAFVGRG